VAPCSVVVIRLQRTRNCLTGAGTSLGRLAAASTTVVHLALGLGVGADVLQGSSVLVVGVDTSQFTAIDGGDALNVYVTLALLAALFRG